MLAGALALPVGALAVGAQQVANPGRPVTAQPFRFDFLGPAGGGRIASIAGVPGDTNTWYMGNASGGVFKSTDAGRTFKPVFDDQPVQAIGALAVAPSDHDVVWAGTGEAWAIRDADVIGDGVYKSTDAGATWKNMGLRETGRIARILVHPTDANVVYVCSTGRMTAPQQERGVYKTTDGGATWKQVLFVDKNTSCSSLAMDAKDPNVLFAGMWQVEMHPWAELSGGPSSGIWTTRDGGATWKRVVHPGLPKSPVGKVGVAIAPTDPNRVYALIQTPDQGSLWRSDDGGKSWRVASWARALIGRAGYYMHLAVSSGNPDEVLVANSSFWRSTDGGLHFNEERWGGDNHDIWIDPTDPDHFGLTNDAGANITTNHGKSFTRVTLPNGQMYHVAVDRQIPYWVYSNRQDNGTMRGPSDGPERDPNALARRFAAAPPRRDSAAAGRGRPGQARADSTAEEAPAYYGAPQPGNEWDHGIGGCESGFTIPDWRDPNIIWASCYGNKLTRYDFRVRTAHSVAPWMITLDAPPGDTKYRCHWTAPLAIDPFDPKTIYYGCQVILKTTNDGQSWTAISPDLSTQDPSRIMSSGGVIGDNLGQFYGEVVFAIAPSEVQQGLIWAGTNDGLVWLTRDGGAQWTNVTKNIPGIPVWGNVRKIEPSHIDAGTAYVVVDAHLMDDSKPYLFKTTDYGKTWKNVSGDLPSTSPLDYLMAVAENPNRKGMLFVGTGHALHYTMDDGAHWTQFKNGLPAAPVSWVVIPKLWHDVVVSTYGRGLWILRDIGALENPVSASTNHLYAPHPGTRKPRTGRADITFSLASAGQVQLDILDATGAVARHMRVRGHEGLNQVTWNLQYDPAPAVELRTTPPDNPHIWDEPRFKGKTTRPIAHWGTEGPLRTGPLAAPGRYTARLTVDGQQQSQSFEILKDLTIPSSDADLVANTAMQVKVRDDLAATAEMVNRIEVMRKQIEDQLKSTSLKASDAKALRDMDAKMLDVELKLLSRSDLHSDDKWFVEAYKVYLNLLWFSGEIGTGAGDVAGSAEYRPTDTQVQILTTIEKDLDSAKAAYKRLMETEVPAFNKMMGTKAIAM
jgi:photosystem II stability/assembly factor-like uncharacterized protein